MAPFASKIQSARRILVVNPRGLGDIIHSLPVVAMLRRTLSHAQVDLLASAHSEDLFAIVPSVRQVLTTPFYPRPNTKLQRYRQRLKVAWRIRKNGYDAIINLQAIESTSMMIALSRAPYKLALRGMLSPIAMPWLYSDVVDQRWRNQSAYRFMLESIAAAGFAVGGCHLGPELVDLSRQQMPDSICAPFFHFSPFTSRTSRQLPCIESQALVTGLLQRYPTHQLVVSCAAAPREAGQIHSMLPAAPAGRIKVFAGTLSLGQLGLVMAHADAHIGPDTGSLHLAWLAGAKTVSWFLNHESLLAWVPYGPQHRILLSLREQVRIGDKAREAEPVPVQCIKAAHILEEVDRLLSAPLPPREQWWSSDQLGFRCIY
ncbi:MAG TPA: glycosyltransferase family 9 protein [Candidatus Margulisiibacteriota bacterium]|nr:glycosyltransferase family 9 protein [Candidatus Margulisiibacteriota bacterium]